MYILQPYDDCLEYVLKHGVRKSNRTGVDTLSVFGYQCRYDISKYFPVVTKRKMFPRSVFAELLWMLSGSTNVRDLESLGSKIWSAWRDEEFEKRNRYEEGLLGPIYGHQLRHFNGVYPAEQSSGFDQIVYVLNELKTNRSSRRILFSYWNPTVVTTDKVKLPPCHVMAIFNVDDQNRLSCMLTQRSGDTPIGIPANIQFYSALTYMLAQQCGDLTPHEFIHCIADTHIYVNQIPAVEEYLSRPVIDSPVLNLIKAPSIDSYVLSDFELQNYNPLDKITIPVAV